MEPATDLLAVVDMGTSGCKVLLFDPSGNVVSSGFSGYTNRQVPPDRVEQDAQVWWRSVAQASVQALEKITHREQIKALSVTAQRASAIPVDGNGNPLRAAIQTQDKRSTPQCDRMRMALGEDEIYRRTGLVVDPYFVAPKILWIQEEEPEIFADAAKFLTVQDFITHQLTAEFAIDVSQASRTLLFNISERSWDAEILNAVAIGVEKLPRTIAAGEVVGHLTVKAAAATGFFKGTPVIAAGGDQPCAALGNGAINTNTLSATTGTGTYVLGSCTQPTFDPHKRFLCSCHVLPGRWAIEAGILVTGAALPWFLDNFYEPKEGEDPYRALEEMAARSSIGARELLFVPHFAGSKSPYWNPKSRACLHGLTLGHTRADIARALLEGIFLEVKKNIDLLVSQDRPDVEVRVSGGVSRSDFFNQLQADIYGLPLRRTSEEATSLGAAILAAHRIGWYASLPDALEEMGARNERDVKRPTPAVHRQYREVLERHHELYLALERAGF